MVDNTTIEKNTDRVMSKHFNLDYLTKITKSDPSLIMEMISAYLEQTPPLIVTMKQSMVNEDWSLLQAAVHKLIPSFSIMGMPLDYQNMARKVHEYASTKENTDRIPDMVLLLENICTQTCKELKEEYNTIKHKINEQGQN